MTLVNTETGEIAKSPESVVEFLENAKWALDVAVEMTGPAEVALMKAQIVMAETYARELSLSKDIQEQAREMVRRAEYALGRAIRKGQEEGRIAKDGERLNRGLPDEKTSPAGYFNGGGEYHDVLTLAAATPDELERALSDAKAEGNTSRANVVRKIKKTSQPDAVLTRQQRADLISDLAKQGLTSRQMPARVGVTEETVRQIARDFSIEIPADRIVGRSKRLDHTQIVESTITGLEDTAEFIAAHIDLNEVDFSEVDEWVSSLNRSIAALNRFRNQLKEKTHV